MLWLVGLTRDDEGHPKGDGSVCYAKAESVQMAINVLHEGQLRPGVSIEVRFRLRSTNEVWFSGRAIESVRFRCF